MMHYSTLNKRRLMTCRSISILTVLVYWVENFKHMNTDLQTFKLSTIGSKWKVCIFSIKLLCFFNDNVIIFAPTKPQKWVTQLVLTVEPLGKNQHILYLFIFQNTSTHFYKGSITCISRSSSQKCIQNILKPYKISINTPQHAKREQDQL